MGNDKNHLRFLLREMRALSKNIFRKFYVISLSFYFCIVLRYCGIYNPVMPFSIAIYCSPVSIYTFGSLY